MTALAYPASLRGAYLVPKDSGLKYCAEPAPDTALESVQKLAAAVKGSAPEGPSGELSFNSELSATVVALAGRTQLVLLAREMLYRACEISINNPDDTSEIAVQLFNKAADLIVALAEADRATAIKNLVTATKGAENARKLLEQFQNQ